ncbi:hypothetical protein SAMN05444521_1344 [Streptomyces sp. 3214.6]|nr:hypothetical protein SAMN05444521_1344 [Streptomyces sp. 3214.6]
MSRQTEKGTRRKIQARVTGNRHHLREPTLRPLGTVNRRGRNRSLTNAHECDTCYATEAA